MVIKKNRNGKSEGDRRHRKNWERKGCGEIPFICHEKEEIESDDGTGENRKRKRKKTQIKERKGKKNFALASSSWLTSFSSFSLSFVLPAFVLVFVVTT